MFFEIGNDGKIMVCAETKIKECMTELVPPPDFVDAEMHNWKIIDSKFINVPLPAPAEKPSQEQRIAALEEQLAAYEAAYLEGVNEA